MVSIKLVVTLYSNCHSVMLGFAFTARFTQYLHVDFFVCKFIGTYKKCETKKTINNADCCIVE